MIGYVQSHRVEDWKVTIQKQIVTDRTLLELAGEQEDCVVHPAFLGEWLSRHRRPGIGKAITIYHILLGCIPETGQPAA